MELKPRPFLKWAGGKTQLLPELLKRIPKSWNPATDLYVEPFVGAGALFWKLRPKRAMLNDANAELIDTYEELRRYWPGVVRNHLRVLARNYSVDPESVYYKARASIDYSALGWTAARMIFLNKTGFNGLYRVNKAGQFNAPWGKNPKATICDEVNLQACAEFLRSCDVRLTAVDFTDVSIGGFNSVGSLWYADPPYIPVSKTSNFTSYTTDGFTYYDQLRLLAHARWLKNQGVHVLLSQAADESLIDQYRRCGFTCDQVQARRAVN